MNNIMNNSIKNLKEKQIYEIEDKKKQLEKEFKEKMLILIGILMSLSIEYSNSDNEYIKLKILSDIKKQLIKYKKVLINYQNDFIKKTLENTFNNNYNQLYIILKLSYDKNIEKSIITGAFINKIIQSKFFDKSLDRRIIDNTTFIFNKINKEVMKEVKENNDSNSIVNTLNNNFDSLIKIENRLLDTEDTRLFNETQKKAFIDFGIENLIWCSVLEKNTCDACANRDGQTFSINDIDMIPLHSNCNCYWEIV